MSKESRKSSDSRKKNVSNIKVSKVGSSKSEVLRKDKESKIQLADERPKTLESMMIDIERRQNEYQQNQLSSNDDNDDHHDHTFSEMIDGHEKSRKTFYREFKKVVDASDIIIEVLDARDPLGCRCPQVEEAVLTSGKNKKLILLLNKIDLIPRDNLDKWLKYLRNEFPTIAFRASTQNQRDRLGHVKVSLKACDEHMLRSSNKCFGAMTLMNLLSNYCRKNDIKTSVTVGIVGYPNVGKSSVINSLKRSQACETGAMPGLTKQMQTVKLDKLIKLFDSPGIVMSKETNPATLILRNCVRIETIENLLPAIELLLHRCSKEQMLLQYDLDDFRDVNDFLMKIAVKMGTLKKGGISDTHKAAQRVLSDWTNGKLTYFTEPPERTNEIIHTELVTQMKEAFDIDALLNNENEEYDDLQTPPSSLVVSNQTCADYEQEEECVSNSGNSNEEEEEMDDDHQSITSNSKQVQFTVQARDKSKRLSKHETTNQIDKHYNDDIRRSVNRSNQIRQQEFKKMKKNQRKTEKTMENLGNALDSIIRLTSTSTTHDSIED
ncbi:hypothetical protein I4U23_006601 [Adineta vaga]|nr:hypothetical protein I4U23_006601 [Adineta vaga]